MKTNIYLLNYNNYYNKIIKGIGYDNLADYIDVENINVYNIKKINFYKNDGVNTSVVVNSYSNEDYILELDDNLNVLTRWFILEAVNLSDTQYRLSIKRDVVADYYDSINEADSYVLKAPVPNNDDPAIYNLENLPVNQIKVREKILKDKTLRPWIVGFYAANTPETTILCQPNNRAEESYASLNDYPFYQYVHSTYYYAKRVRCEIYANVGGVFGDKIKFFPDRGSYSTVNVPSNNYCIDLSKREVNGFNQYVASKNSDIIEEFKDRYSSVRYTNEILKEDNKVIKVGNAYYQVTVKRSGQFTRTETIDKSSAISTAIFDIIKEQYPDVVTTVARANSITFELVMDGYTIELDPNVVGSLSTTIKTTSNSLNDAPYKMFAIPYGSISLDVGGSYQGTMTQQDSLAFASKIAETLGSNIYDIQLLPYCPIQELMDDNVLHTTGLTINNDYNFITHEDDIKGIIVYPTKSTFTFDITESINIPSDVIESKVWNESKIYRLVSPNYSSSFEFNPIRTGSITKFNVDCTYKPYSSYIHINPNWERLYGTDYDDARGLIVQGDFSIPIISDAWVQYQINNKNYLNVFNREIESLELSQKIQRTREIVGATVGAFSGATTGAAAGSIAAGPVGAAIGGVASGIASAAGGVIDVAMNDKLRQEQISLNKDKFNYSLQNIKALPYTLAKISSFDANNKIIPFIEEYDCTDIEKDAIKEKMRLNGMTINRIGKLNQFIKTGINYYQMELIRIDIQEDYHLINTIAEEMAKGVYIDGDSI